MKLNHRERTIVGVAGVIILGVLIFQFVISPMAKRRDTLSRVVPRHEKALAELRATAAAYTRLQADIQARRDRIREQPANFSLLSFVEEIEQKRQLLDRVADVGRSSGDVGKEYEQVRVELELEGVTLDQVLGLLADLHTAPAPVVVDLLQIRRSRERDREGFLDLTIGISLLRAKSPG